MSILRKSWLGNVNYFILQWFFIRLAKKGHMNKDNVFVLDNFSILCFIVPMTGWDNNEFKWLFGKQILPRTAKD